MKNENEDEKWEIRMRNEKWEMRNKNENEIQKWKMRIELWINKKRFF